MERSTIKKFTQKTFVKLISNYLKKKEESLFFRQSRKEFFFLSFKFFLVKVYCFVRSFKKKEYFMFRKLDFLIFVNF